MNGKIMLNGKAYSSSGRPSKEVTMAEWLALPDTKYTNGIVYYIKDVGSSSQYPPLIYSDEEREVGVWRDGKPLYQKTFVSNYTFHTNSSQHVAIDIHDLNIDTPVAINGFWRRWAGDNAKLWYQFGSDEAQYGIAWARVDSENNYANGQLSIMMTSDGSDCQIITLQYTKTTDLPGSGMWNTDGGKMHHYSTDEKVVGTWIDGKPIYEKTIELSSQQQIATGSWYNLPMSNTGIAKIIRVTAMNQTGTRWECVGGNCDVGSYCQLANFRGDYIGVKVVTLQYTKTTD